MTQTATIERKANELATLIREHRVIRIEHYTGQHLTITTKVAIPEYGIQAGEIVHLVASDSHPGYYYIVSWNEHQGHTCTCPARYQCKHRTLVNEVCKSRYHQRKAVPARQFEDWGEESVHVRDSAVAGQLGARTQVAFAGREQRMAVPLASGRAQWVNGIPMR